MRQKFKGCAHVLRGWLVVGAVISGFDSSDDKCDALSYRVPHEDFSTFSGYSKTNGWHAAMATHALRLANPPAAQDIARTLTNEAVERAVDAARRGARELV